MKFKFHDGGRREAGFNGLAGDCVVRAIAIAAELPYIEFYKSLEVKNALYASSKKDRLARSISRRGPTPRDGNHRKVFHSYILSLGFQWVPTMKVGSGCQVHLRAGEIPNGKVIARVSKHTTAIINGVIYDTHNPARNGSRCVYGYYIKDGLPLEHSGINKSLFNVVRNKFLKLFFEHTAR